MTYLLTYLLRCFSLLMYVTDVLVPDSGQSTCSHTDYASFLKSRGLNWLHFAIQV